MTETAGICKQEIICVLGMHRSGTSLLARILNLLGVALGSEEVFTTEPVADNPKGYWEHNEITSISDTILRRFGGRWDEPPLLPPGWETSATLTDLGERARRLIREQFAEAPLWGWKDPRSCLTLPFWQQLLPGMRYILCLRNPVEVARSLERRDGLSAEKSSHLWLSYVSSALSHSEGKPRLIIFYEDLIDDYQGELPRLAEFLGKTERARQPEVQGAVREFIEKGLRHHRISAVQAVAAPGINPRAKALYLAQRITADVCREGVNGRQVLDDRTHRALEALSRPPTEDPGHAGPPTARLTENAQAPDTLSARLAEKDRTVQRLSTQLAQQAGDLQSQAECVRALTAQLLDVGIQPRPMSDTWEWRLLSRYARLKHNYLLPIYKRLGRAFGRATRSEPRGFN